MHGGPDLAAVRPLAVSRLASARLALLRPVPGASLAAYRAAFGVTVAVEVVRYLANGWVWAYYVEPAVRLTYYGWSWVPSAPFGVLVGVFLALGLCGLFLAGGLATRAAAVLTTVGLGYVFLLEQGRYLNHIYLMVAMSALLALLPAGRSWSADARLDTGRWRGPGAVPAWAVWAVRAHLGIVYAFAAVAKLNPDWLRGEPIASWLAPTFAGSPLDFVLDVPGWGLLFAWGGLALDGLALPLLLWRRTRVPMALALVGFHLFNAWAFSIGVFPWLMIAVLPIFFDPDWPERLWGRLRKDEGQTTTDTGDAPSPHAFVVDHPSLLVLTLLVAFFSLQLTLPLRHWLYPGDVAWTEEGHTYAWRMKLRSKHAPFAELDVVTGRDTLRVRPEERLVSWQARKVPTRPDLLLQFAHALADEARAEGHDSARVYARVEVRLNDRPPQLFVDPTVDLAAVPRSWRPKRWILPLDPDGDGPRIGDLDTANPARD